MRRAAQLVLPRGEGATTETQVCVWVAQRLHVRQRGLVPLAAVTAAAASTTTSTTAVATSTSLFARASFVNGQVTAFDFLQVEALDGRLALGGIAHFDEAEAFAPAGVA